jgi:hypothetical protein
MAASALVSQLVIRWRREHLLNKEVILHKNLLRLLELRVEVRNLNFWLLTPLRLALTIVVSSLEPIALLLLGLILLLIVYLINVGVSGLL